MNGVKSTAGLNKSFQCDPFPEIQINPRAVQKHDRRIIGKGIIGKKTTRIGCVDFKAVDVSEMLNGLQKLPG